MKKILDILDTEDKLQEIKYLFTLSIKGKVYPENILICNLYQNWIIESNFRLESLSISLDDPRNLSMIKGIYNLSLEINKLHSELMHYRKRDEYKYEIECMPKKGGFVKVFLIRTLKNKKEIVENNRLIDIRESYSEKDNLWKHYPGLFLSKPNIFYFDEKFVKATPSSLCIYALEICLFLKDKIIKPLDKKEETPIKLPDHSIVDKEKPCRSLMRARAFCINEIIKNRYKDKHNQPGKKAIIELVGKEFPDQSGKTVYEELKINGLANHISDYPEDYKYGMELFKTKYPDS